MTTCIFNSSSTPYTVLVTTDNNPPNLPFSVPKGSKIEYTLIGGGGAGYGAKNEAGGGGGSGETRTGFIIADTNFIINVGTGGKTTGSINGIGTNIYSGINELASAGGGFGAVDVNGGMGGNGALGGIGGLGTNNAGPAQTKNVSLTGGYYSISYGGGGGSDSRRIASNGADGGTRGINGKNSGNVNVYGAGGGGGGPGGGGGGGGAATGQGVPGPGGVGKTSPYGSPGQDGGNGFLNADGGNGGYGGYGGSDSGGGGGGGGKPISGGTSFGGNGGSGLAILKVLGYVNLSLDIQGNLCAGKEALIGSITVAPPGGTLVVTIKWDDNNTTQGTVSGGPNTYSLFVSPPSEAKYYIDVLITCEYTVNGNIITSETTTNIDTRETVNFTLNHEIEGCSPQILGLGYSKCYELDNLEAKYSLDGGASWLPATVNVNGDETFTVQPEDIINPGEYDIIVKIFNNNFSETFEKSITVKVGFTLNCVPILQTSTCSNVIGLGIGTCCGLITLEINYTQTGGPYDQSITPIPAICNNGFYSVSFIRTLVAGTYYLEVKATSQGITLTNRVTLIISNGDPTLNVRNIKVCPTVTVLVGNGVVCSPDITAEVELNGNSIVPNPILSFGSPPNTNRYFINIQAPISPGEYDMIVRIKDNVTGNTLIERQAKLIVQNYFFVEVLNQTYCEDYGKIKIAIGHECPPGNIVSVTWNGVDITSHCSLVKEFDGDFSIYTTYKPDPAPGIYDVNIVYGLNNNIVSSSGTITISPTLELNTFNLRVCEQENPNIILATGISCDALTSCKVLIGGEETTCSIEQNGRYFTISGDIPNSEGIYLVKVRVFMGENIYKDSEFTLSVTPYLNIFPSNVFVCQGIESAVVGYGISCQRGIIANFNGENCIIQYHGDMFTITANNITLIPGIYNTNTLTITYNQGSSFQEYNVEVTVIPKVNIIPENNFICKGGTMIRVATGITCGKIASVEVKWEGDPYPSNSIVLPSKRYSVIAESPEEPGYYEGTVTVTDKNGNTETKDIYVLVQCGFTLISKEQITCPGNILIAEGTVCNYQYPTYEVTWNPPFDGEYTLETKCSSYKIYSDTPNSGSYQVTIKAMSGNEIKEVISDITISRESSLQAVGDSTIKCQTETVVAIICSGCSVEISEPLVKWKDVVYKSKIVENRIISEVPKESGIYKVDVSLGSSSVSLNMEVKNEIELIGLDLTMKQGYENLCVAIGSYPYNIPSICVSILGKTIPSVIKTNGSMFSVYCDININKPGKYEIYVGNKDIWVLSNLEVLGSLVVLGMDKRRLEVKSLSKHPYVFKRKEKIKMVKLEKNLYILDGNYLGYTLSDDINYLSLNEYL